MRSHHIQYGAVWVFLGVCIFFGGVVEAAPCPQGKPLSVMRVRSWRGDWLSRLKVELNLFAGTLKGKNDVILIAGHTNSRGSSRFNQVRSLKRAEQVRAFLQKLGVKSPIRVVGMGEDCPIASNRTRKGRMFNARIAFHRVGGGPPPVRRLTTLLKAPSRRIFPAFSACPKQYMKPTNASLCPKTVTLHFASGRYKRFANPARTCPVLALFARCALSTYQAKSLLIAGHRDVREKAFTLIGKKRATYLSRVLMMMGMKKNRMTIRGYGHLRPIRSNRTQVGRAANRRVELSLR